MHRTKQVENQQIVTGNKQTMSDTSVIGNGNESSRENVGVNPKAKSCSCILLKRNEIQFEEKRVQIT